MEKAAQTVYVVDDDPDVLKAIERLLLSEGLDVATFPSPHLFLQRYNRNAPGCLVLDLALPGLSGLELQRVLETETTPLPIIFLTGHGDVPASVQAMKHGAADFLTKPVDDAVLLSAVRNALVQSQELTREYNDRQRTARCDFQGLH